MERHTRFLHIVNLTDYQTNIKNIRNNIDKLRNNFKYQKELKTMMYVMERKLSALTQNLQLIQPKIRNRRGIINGLGSLIKAVTGNLDDNDLDQINTQISNLNENQHNLNLQINHQIRINEKMIERFNNITDHINNQQESLSKILNEAGNNLNNQLGRLGQEISLNQYCNQIIYDIDYLNEHVVSIIESVALAKLNVIHKNILHPDELHYVHKILTEQKINIMSNEDIYQLLELQTFYNNSNLIFSINIPKFHPETFSMYQINQIPDKNNLSINTNNKFILYNAKKYQFRDKPCPVVANTMICTKQQLLETEMDNCITKIISGEKAKCSMISTNEFTIKLIQPNFLLYVTTSSEIVTTNCGNQHTNFTLTGKHLIHFNNCSIKLNNITYSSSLATFWDSIQIIPYTYSEINITDIQYKPTINQLGKWSMDNIQQIKMLKSKSIIHTICHYTTSISTIAILIILTIYLIYKVTRKIKSRRSYQLRLQQLRLQRNAIQRNYSASMGDLPNASVFSNLSQSSCSATLPGVPLWASLHPKKGGVM